MSTPEGPSHGYENYEGRTSELKDALVEIELAYTEGLAHLAELEADLTELLAIEESSTEDELGALPPSLIESARKRIVQTNHLLEGMAALRKDFERKAVLSENLGKELDALTGEYLSHLGSKLSKN